MRGRQCRDGLVRARYWPVASAACRMSTRDRRHPHRDPRRARRPTSSAALPLPATVRGALVQGRRAGDVRRRGVGGEGPAQVDRTSSEFPLPELAPDEAFVAVMASAINFNTVWTSIFEPLPTFGFLQAARQGERVGRAPRPAVPRDGQRRVGRGAARRLGGAQLEAGRRGHRALQPRRRPGPDRRTTTR